MRIAAAVAAGLVLCVGTALAQPAATDYPPRGIDDGARELIATKAPVGLVATCAASYAAAAFVARDAAERRRREESGAGMLALLPVVAERTGVAEARMNGALALAMMPVRTRSASLDPQGNGGAVTAETEARCARIAESPGRYVEGLARP